MSNNTDDRHETENPLNEHNDNEEDIIKVSLISFDTQKKDICDKKLLEEAEDQNKPKKKIVDLIFL